MQPPPCSSSPENSTPTGRATGPAASASRMAAIAPLMSAVPRPCSRSPRAHQQVRRRRVALVGGHGVDVRVQQQRAARRRRSARRRRRDPRRPPPRPTPAPSARSSARQPLHQRPLVPVGLWVSNETSSASRSTRQSAVAIAEGYTMSASVSPAAAALALRPCRPGAAPASPRARVLPPRPHIAADAHGAAPGHRRPARRSGVGDGAAPSDAFVQHFPDEGAPPSERDHACACSTTTRPSTSASTASRSTRRSCGASPGATRSSPSDGVWIDIDSRRTGVSAFHFGVNAAGVLSDGIHFDDTNVSSDWDAVWEAQGRRHRRGYSVEFRIPLRVLRFSALPVQGWGFQVRRFIDARQETDDWAFYPRSAASVRPAVRPARRPARPAAAPRARAAAVRARARRLPRRRRDTTPDARLAGGRVGRARRQGARHATS